MLIVRLNPVLTCCLAMDSFRRKFQEFQIHTSYSSWFSWEWFTCMHYYLNLKSFPMLSIEPNEGISYFAFHKHEKIEVRAFTSFTSSLDCIYKMYLRIFWLLVIFKGKRPSSALQAILEALLFSSKYRLQNWRCAFSICEPSVWFCTHTPNFAVIC